MEQSLKHLRFPLALLAVLVMSACGKAPQTAANMPAAKVSVAKVLEQPVNEWDEFTGRLEAPETVQIRPRVSGQIDQVAFTEGALVKKATCCSRSTHGRSRPKYAAWKPSCNKPAPPPPAVPMKPSAASAC